jgi:hypothetical protein
MVLCCIEESSISWDNLTAIGTIILALGTIILAGAAVLEVRHIKNIIGQYAFSAFLIQEDNLQSKKSIFETTLNERERLLDRLLIQAPPINPATNSEFQSLQTKFELEKKQFLLALDRFASQILKPEFPEKELMKNIHKDFLNDTTSKYATEIADTHFENIAKLQIHWGQQ